jgi:hypothetical protein
MNIMAQTWDGEDSPKNLVLKGKKVIVENIGVYDGSTQPACSYRREVIYHFSSEDKAKEYYYKNR